MKQNFIQSRNYLLLLLISIGILWGCSSSQNDPTPTNQYLVSSSVVGEFTTAQLSARVDGAALGSDNVGNRCSERSHQKPNQGYQSSV
jgi:hypothetical protein